MTDNALDTPVSNTPQAARIAAEGARRRTFAVISHPDAGKSTLTEALALHARVITEAGAIHGKAGRRSTVSDWMEMEKARGISITSTALQFPYRDCVINLLDTPGHADFSEDTYRVLTAVDAAVMLIDAAKGLEPQTLKLFQVCKHRGIPIITVINKWDRPGRHALELMDEIHERIGLRTTPLTWPVGIAGDFKGVMDRRADKFIRFTRTAGGATAAPEEHIAAADAHAAAGDDWDTAVEESELLSVDGSDYDRDTFLGGESSPVLFTSAALNFGVNQLLDVLVELAPAPNGAVDVDGARRAVESPFSAFVFKVQAGMDSSHRDRIAYARVVSGTFERGDVLTHAATAKPFVTKYAQSVFGQQRSTLDDAWPGDVIGLANAAALRPGDTLYRDIPVVYPPIPSFSPEHFAVARGTDPSKHKQFRRGIEQLEQEGVVQVLRSDKRGEQAPVFGAVGPMQFEVAAHRMATELSAPISLESLPYQIARVVAPEDAEFVNRQVSAEVLTRSDGVMLVLFSTPWRLEGFQRDNPNIKLGSLVAAEG
ncbi:MULTISPECIES: peptide chain release factor 3 [unclassified Mycolicibacterium]|uniref:peptide chain release factor 3 n=1 Tax=unclassified Mycolicibacterium TaxID=2636767 RepID=UPI0012DF5445|nr:MULTISPECIES: peptide chain release factor 3 [unclassified Mycolicibacterium]MUL81548.1 peptide chain release factor 3 [Mycolicibacterium sp. CBMA 329]MUL87314.1 peptide chain release factor 3 [Mycolicibacterium sp. CBMA 331]MUM02601.1 peptide chain release factor 3 [Mycolicibacterium sp. CBMA 334]MUM25164.1 peptide chain release factor 3 [Mycolicibacterium sp. CBMA 295]MUM37611.1 peptide chain release factor 3 [Mycolicibacterium sp. CBMA 247]